MGLDRGNRGGSDCVSCLREGCARAEQGARVCKSWVEECACQGKEVTKCYMRVTAPFPTQRATLLAQNEDIVPLLLQSNAKKGAATFAIQTLHRATRQMGNKKTG